jgi:lipopolysaccharide biosynthesis protein
MRSVCFFSSYFTEGNIPAYVKFYLKELTNHFSKIVFVTTEKEIQSVDKAFLSENKIQLQLFSNEGYDFGLWYKALKEYDLSGYDRIGLVNDSCILFGKFGSFFQWLDKESPDVAGFTDSYLLKHHLQSYFLVINKKAIPLVLAYFTKNGIVTDNAGVIETYEIGLSQYLMNNSMEIKAMYPVPGQGQYNYALMDAKKLIEQGFPLIKKKIITRGYIRERWWSMVVMGFDPFPSHYIKQIKRLYTIPADLFNGLTGKNGIASDLWFNIVSRLAIIWGTLKHKRS